MLTISRPEFILLSKAVADYWWEARLKNLGKSEGQNLEIARAVFYNCKYKIINNKSRKASTNPFLYEETVRVVISSIGAFFLCYFKDRPNPTCKEDLHDALRYFYYSDTVSMFYINNEKEVTKFFKSVHELFFVHLQSQVFEDFSNKVSEFFTKFPYYDMDNEDKQSLDDAIKKLSEEVMAKTGQNFEDCQNFVYVNLATITNNFAESLLYNLSSINQYYPDLIKGVKIDN